jgi:hypothetical protein
MIQYSTHGMGQNFIMRGNDARLIQKLLISCFLSLQEFLMARTEITKKYASMNEPLITQWFKQDFQHKEMIFLGLNRASQKSKMES